MFANSGKIQPVELIGSSSIKCRFSRAQRSPQTLATVERMHRLQGIDVSFNPMNTSCRPVILLLMNSTSATGQPSCEAGPASSVDGLLSRRRATLWRARSRSGAACCDCDSAEVAVESSRATDPCSAMLKEGLFAHGLHVLLSSLSSASYWARRADSSSSCCCCASRMGPAQTAALATSTEISPLRRASSLGACNRDGNAQRFADHFDGSGLWR